MVGAIVVIAFDNQILTGGKSFQPGKNGIPFLKAGVPSAVDAKREQPAFFQKRKGLGQGFKAGIFLGGFFMISSRKVPEIKYNTAYRTWGSILFHICMGIQDQSVIRRGVCMEQALFCVYKGGFLYIKGKYLSLWAS